MIEPYTDPKFYDKKIAEINVDLTALGWIETVYPLTQIGVDEEGTFPEVYRNDGTKKSQRVYPHGNSISFFALNDTLTRIDESDMYTVNFGLIVWADLTKVNTDKDYNYTTELINDVRRVIDSNDGYDYSIELQGVFSDYDQLEKVENQNTMLPNTAFKINFTCDLLTC